MDFIGQVGGMNFNPITNYNNYLNKTHALDVDVDSMDFEKVLNQHSAAMQTPLQGGIQMNKLVMLQYSILFSLCLKVFLRVMFWVIFQKL